MDLIKNNSGVATKILVVVAIVAVAAIAAVVMMQGGSKAAPAAPGGGGNNGLPPPGAAAPPSEPPAPPANPPAGTLDCNDLLALEDVKGVFGDSTTLELGTPSNTMYSRTCTMTFTNPEVSASVIVIEELGGGGVTASQMLQSVIGTSCKDKASLNLGDTSCASMAADSPSIVFAKGTHFIQIICLGSGCGQEKSVELGNVIANKL
jgi:hypothetical protein